jgi:lysophospholipase L1-like esterase
VAREYGLQVIDLHTLFADGQDMVQPDGIHPNEKGVKRMAEIIAEKLLAP